MHPTTRNIQLTPATSKDLNNQIIIISTNRTNIRSPSVSNRLLSVKLTKQHPYCASNAATASNAPRRTLGRTITLQLTKVLHTQNSAIVLAQNSSTSVKPYGSSHTHVTGQTKTSLLISVRNSNSSANGHNFRVVCTPGVRNNSPLTIHSQSTTLILTRSLTTKAGLPPSGCGKAPRTPVSTHAGLNTLDVLAQAPNVLIRLNGLGGPTS